MAAVSGAKERAGALSRVELRGSGNVFAEVKTSFFNGKEVRPPDVPEGHALTASVGRGQRASIVGDAALSGSLADFNVSSVEGRQLAEGVPVECRGEARSSLLQQGRRILAVFIEAFQSLAKLTGMDACSLPDCLSAGKTSEVDDLMSVSDKIDRKLSDISARNALLLLACVLDRHHERNGGRQKEGERLTLSEERTLMKFVSNQLGDDQKKIQEIMCKDGDGRLGHIKDIAKNLGVAVYEDMGGEVDFSRGAVEKRSVSFGVLRKVLEEKNKKVMMECLGHTDELKGTVKDLIEDFSEYVAVDVVMPQVEEGDMEKAEACEAWLMDARQVFQNTLEGIDKHAFRRISNTLLPPSFADRSPPAFVVGNKQGCLDWYDASVKEVGDFVRMGDEWEIIDMGDVIP